MLPPVRLSPPFPRGLRLECLTGIIWDPRTPCRGTAPSPSHWGQHTRTKSLRVCPGKTEPSSHGHINVPHSCLLEASCPAQRCWKGSPAPATLAREQGLSTTWLLLCPCAKRGRLSSREMSPGCCWEAELPERRGKRRGCHGLITSEAQQPIPVDGSPHP